MWVLEDMELVMLQPIGDVLSEARAYEQELMGVADGGWQWWNVKSEGQLHDQK